MKNMDKKMPKFAKRLLVIVPCAIAALIVVAGCFDIVPAGYKGVKLTMGADWFAKTSLTPNPQAALIKILY